STAAGLLAAAWTADMQPSGETDAPPPWWTRLLPRQVTVGWVTGIAALAAALAFAGGWADPYRPYWPCAVVLASGGLTGALALWTRRGGFVYASGLLVNVAGHLAWLAWAETGGAPAGSVVERLLLTHVLCLALASLAWSVIELCGRRVLGMPELAERVPPFRHLAAWAALGLLAATVGF